MIIIDYNASPNIFEGVKLNDRIFTSYRNSKGGKITKTKMSKRKGLKIEKNFNVATIYNSCFASNRCYSNVF